LDRSEIANRYAAERREKLLGELPSYIRRGDEGLDNGLGWFVQGFIEDYEGELRPQSHEETNYCMGCHTSIATTLDSVFSMGRKVTGGAGWRYVDLVGMPDAPSIAEPGGEIANYLARAGGGSEFRENLEMLQRFFDAAGQVNPAAVAAAPDVYTLVTPSRRRALDLDKAYVHIVRHQSFIVGRDASIAPVTNVLRTVDDTSVPLEPRSGASSAGTSGWTGPLRSAPPSDAHVTAAARSELHASRDVAGRAPECRSPARWLSRSARIPPPDAE
jgi:hypothetical protein